MTRAWHEEAKRLYAEGASPPAIAAKLGKPRLSVFYAVDHKGEKRKVHDRVAKLRAANPHYCRDWVRKKKAERQEFILSQYGQA